MAQPQNLCRAVGFIPEGKRFFRWLQAEGTINEAIATELYERAKWKRNTIHEDRSFAITYPFFAAAGAVHVPDVASLFIEGDPLGIKGRVSFFYTRPAFEHAAAIREANAKINSAGTLLDDVANFFWPCHSTHDPVWAGLDRFVRQKDYPFRFYTLSPDAATVFDERFDHHVDEQKAAHLQDQEKAKFHGKAKTKHLRLALALHLHEQTFARRTSETWETVLDSKHLVVAEEVGKYMDMVATRLGDFFNLVMNPSVPSPSIGAGGARAVKLSAREQLNQILTGEWASFQTLPSDQQTAFWTLGQAVLMSHAVWLEGAALARQQNVRAWLPSLGENAIPRVACCLRHLGLIEIVQGKNTHGTALFYMVKRHLHPQILLFNLFSNVLQEFEVGLHAYKTCPPETLAQHQPPKAMGLPVFADIPEASLREKLPVVAAWRAAAHEGVGVAPAAAAARARTIN